jgi:signal transduction histidine kinase
VTTNEPTTTHGPTTSGGPPTTDSSTTENSVATDGAVTTNGARPDAGGALVRRQGVLRSRRDPETGNRWPLARVFAVAASVSALLILAVVALLATSLWRLDEARSALLDVAGPGLVAGQQLEVALLDQESSVRGFGLTGDQDFLQPYSDGLSSQRAAMAELRMLATDRGLAEIAPELDRVEQAEQQWRTQYAQLVVDRSATAPAPEAGGVLFAQVRAATAVLLDDLQAQRSAARDRINGASGFLGWAGAIAAVVLVVFLVAAGVGLRIGVLRPISDLAAQVRDVVSGGVTRQVRARGPREMRELGEDVEAMRRHILRDLDEAQAVNRRLDEQARDLERSNRDLEQFAYVASHDLQEPLRKVSSFCQLLQRRYAGQLDERADQYIAFAVDGASRMQRLINDLLAFSRCRGTHPCCRLSWLISSATGSSSTGRVCLPSSASSPGAPTTPGRSRSPTTASGSSPSTARRSS